MKKKCNPFKVMTKDVLNGILIMSFVLLCFAHLFIFLPFAIFGCNSYAVPKCTPIVYISRVIIFPEIIAFIVWCLYDWYKDAEKRCK